MNEEIYHHFQSIKKIDILDSTTNLLLIKILKYFDKHSLKLHDIDSNIFTFTNDAQFLTFSLNELVSYQMKMNNGILFPWKKFEI